MTPVPSGAPGKRPSMLARYIAAAVFLLALLAYGLLAACSSAAKPAAPAPDQPTAGQVDVQVMAQGLANPWSIAFLPDGTALITERPGRLRLWQPDGGLSAPIAGVPDVYAAGQGGLLDVALSPAFADDRRVYLSFAEARDGRAGTAVGYGVLSQDKRRLDNFKVIFRQNPPLSSGIHFGSRLVFGTDGLLYVTLGDNNQRAAAQELNQHQGKVVRITPEGGIPAGNPFADRSPEAAPVWSYGHRNPQGAALHPGTGQLWVHEHGPRGGDEINIVQPGENYGWPLATHGINYSGLAIPEAQGEAVEGTAAPHFVWEVSPAISGMAFYTHSRFPAWQSSLFVGALKQQALIRLTLDGDRIVAEERLLTDRNQRIRDVRAGPDGYLYVLTDGPDGQLLRVGL